MSNLTKERQGLVRKGREVLRVVLEVVEEQQRPIHHVHASARSLGFPLKSGRSMPDIAVRLLYNICQIFAKKVAIFWQASKKALPLVDRKPLSRAKFCFFSPLIKCHISSTWTCS